MANLDDDLDPPTAPEPVRMLGRPLDVGPPGEGMSDAHDARAADWVDTMSTLRRRSRKLVEVLCDLVENEGVEPKERGAIGLGLLKIATPTEERARTPGDILSQIADAVAKA